MGFLNYLSLGIWGALALIVNGWLSKRLTWPRFWRVLLSFAIAYILTAIVMLLMVTLTSG